ncbi:MAG TPA: TonB-dependent receptor plug domain-containing protein, partial [Niabella sp.]|nr:TonB-dependent receptor plug domain-containing protein [Niabella sp.]
MPVIIDYILKLNICLGFVYLFYQLFLRKLTFYNWNRWYLLGYTALSFIIPLIDIMPSLQKRDLQSTAMMQWIPVINFVPPQDQGFFETLTYWDWSVAVLVIGSLILLVRFLVRFYSFQKMRSRAQLLSDDQTKIYQLDDHITPFSFGNSIFINTEMHHGEELEEIIRHEFVHVKQRHTIDIIWCEALCILNWFNPFVWMLRHNVKQNLEFIADNKVLQNGLDKKEYQYLLLKVLGSRQFAFTNHFNFSSLKKRIAMMNTIKSTKIHLIKFLFLLPVVAVLLLSFRKEVIRLQEKQYASEENLNDDPGKKAPENLVDDSKKLLVISSIVPFEKDTVPAEKKKMSIVLKSTSSTANPPLIVVDGVEMDRTYNLEAVDAEDIESVSVLKDGNANALYGEKGKDGVIIVTTKGSASLTRTFGNLQPLYVLDGLPIERSALKSINSDQIESVNILKDASAKALFGPKAENGVVLVTTKTGRPKTDSITFSAKGDKILLRKAENGYTHEMEASKIIMKDGGKTIVASGNVSGTVSPNAKVAVDTISFHPKAGSKTDEVTVIGYGTKNQDLSLKGKVTGVQVKPTEKAEVIVRGRNGSLQGNVYY